MKRYINTLICLVCAIAAFAQAPQKFNYQAVARDAQGEILPNQNVKIRASILDGSANGTNQYSEMHSVSTSQLGLFNLAIGGGTIVSGNFADITWANSNKYLKIEMDATGGNNFLLVGTSQLLSVPYAVFADKTNLIGGSGISIDGNTINNTGDLSNANELQQLQLNGNTLSLSNGGGSVSLPSGSNTLIGGSGISINGNTINNTGDLSNANELQQLQLNGNILSLSNGGGSVSLPSGSNTLTTSTTNQILNYINPYNGLTFLNTDDNSIYYYSGGIWNKITSIPVTPPGSICVNDALVVYYTFDENNIGEDVINNNINYDGINTGVAFSDDVNSIINSGQSADFSNNDKITTPENPLYNLSQGSICFWLKASAASLPIIHGNSASSGYFTVEIVQSKVNYNSLSGNDFFNFDITPYLNSAWHHFVITLKPNEHRLYIDGALIENITSKAWGLHGTQSNSGMIIGKYSTESLVGKLDNVRIHSRVLSQAEVQQIYNCGQ